MYFIKIIRNFILSTLFVIRGKKPWSIGYGIYRRKCISDYLNKGSFNSGLLEKNYGYRLDERIIEYPWLLWRLPEGSGLLLDAGSALNARYLLDNPKLNSKKIFISTLAPEPSCYPSKNVFYVFEDLRNSCFKDVFFDYIVSISTLEHIGLDNTFLYTTDKSKQENNPMSHLDAIREFRRMLKPMGKLYLTVPFGKHRNHRWFQVFDSDMLDHIVDTFLPRNVEEFIYQYTTSGWIPSSRKDSENSTCFDIHSIKQYEPDMVAFSRAVACIEMEK